MPAEIADYDEARHFETAARHWTEIGWLENEAEKERVRSTWRVGRVLVGVVDDSAEALGHWVHGSIRYLDDEVSMGAITAITTGHVARRHRFATRITAQCVAEAALDGCEVAALGIFDQGFYDRHGFGTGPYLHRVTFDPAQLDVAVPDRPVVRLTSDDDALIFEAMRRRHPQHGGVMLPAEMVATELRWVERGLGLGYRDGDRLTHFVFLKNPLGDEPRQAIFVGYETPAQFVELLGLLRSLADQTRSVTMVEPEGVQLQDFLSRPIRDHVRTAGSKHASRVEAMAIWQLRINDVVRCLERTPWLGEPLRFNVSVEDPITAFQDLWPGAGGDYVVEADGKLAVSPGHDPGSPTLACGVAELSRWWLGVLPGSSLALRPGFAGPPDLLAALDRGHRVPTPFMGWDF